MGVGLRERRDWRERCGGGDVGESSSAGDVHASSFRPPVGLWRVRVNNYTDRRSSTYTYTCNASTALLNTFISKHVYMAKIQYHLSILCLGKPITRFDSFFHSSCCMATLSIVVGGYMYGSVTMVLI